ncbi:MAG TPA: restriction endonuclease [Luteimonas sp.]|nr:restriction endonuclease [Luteimonas sp.]
MTESAHWIIALAVTVLIGVAGTLYFRLVVMRRDETAAGLAALAAMSWREFIHLVLDAMGRRGCARVFDREAPSGDDDYTLERDGRRYLLSCKHGSAFVLGSGQVAELGNAIRLANATGGILATQGAIAMEARPAAKMQRIELLDGPALWPELRDLIDAESRASILAGAATRARQRTLLSWLLALVAGLAVFLALPSPPPGASSTVAAPAQRSAPAPAPAPASDAAPAAVPAADDSEEGLERQRTDVADAVSTLPMVDRAVWSTQSTLQVYLLETQPDAFDEICPLLLRHDALASSRVQLTPPPGSTAQTRFRQCRSY